MSATLTDIINAKYTVLDEVRNVYNYINQHLNGWYHIGYANHSAGTRKEYYMFVGGITPIVYNGSIYDFDLSTRGYICVTSSIATGSIQAIDASTDSTLKNVLTKGTSDPDDDPTSLEPITIDIVNTNLGGALNVFITT